MKITDVLDYYEKDLTVEYWCEFCGNRHIGYFRDDDFGRDEVVPKMRCKKCRRSTYEVNKALGKKGN